MPLLMVKCKNCGFEYPFATQMNVETLKAIRLDSSRENCPECKRVSAYNKADYFFK
jgi:uncharacterized Zn finger protein